jgi:CubicO group peptidase (beta-lactamase class C family)
MNFIKKMISKRKLLILTYIFTHSILFAQDSVKINKEIEDIIKQYGENDFSGSILLKSNDSIIHYSSYGYAQKEEKVKYTNNTSFSIGSIGKMITSTIIMRLYEQNKINLHEPISNYLENIPKDKQKITIHHLLTHTSGLPDFFTSGNDFKRMKKEKAYQKIMNLKLQSLPGNKYSYSNSGYNILAMIIEKVTSEDYLNYATNLFKNIGMSKTGFSGKMVWKKNEIARGYGLEKKGDNTPNS